MTSQAHSLVFSVLFVDNTLYVVGGRGAAGGGIVDVCVCKQVRL